MKYSQNKNAEALASVGVCSLPVMFVSMFFQGVSIGAGIYIAQLIGAGKHNEISRAFNTMYTLVACISAAVGILGIGLAEPLFRALDTPVEILPGAVLYFRIVCACMPGMSIYLAGAQALRSIGDTKAPLYFLIFCAISNVALNVLFVAFMHMGVAGVAWATFISQYLSGILVLRRTSSTTYCRILINHSTLRADPVMSKIMLRLGIPTALTSAITSLGSMFCQKYINFFGASAVAANTAVHRVDGFIALPCYALGAAISVFIGQNLAARRNERIKKAVWFSMGTATLITVVLSAIFYVYAGSLVRVFTDNEQVIILGTQMSRVLCFSYWTMAVYNVLVAIMRGAGDTLSGMVISVIGAIAQVPLSYYMAINLETPTFANLYWAKGSTYALMMLLSLVYYLAGRWKKKVVVDVSKSAG